MKRTSKDREQDRLTAGEECWLLRGTLLYEVTIIEPRTCMVGEPSEFTMYRVDSSMFHVREESQHRSDLFRRPSEIAELRDRIESDIHSFNYMLDELRDVGKPEDEDA